MACASAFFLTHGVLGQGWSREGAYAMHVPDLGIAVDSGVCILVSEMTRSVIRSVWEALHAKHRSGTHQSMDEETARLTD